MIGSREQPYTLVLADWMIALIEEQEGDLSAYLRRFFIPHVNCYNQNGVLRGSTVDAHLQPPE